MKEDSQCLAALAKMSEGIVLTNIKKTKQKKAALARISEEHRSYK